MPQELPFPALGDLVRVRGDLWRVIELAAHADCSVVRLLGARSSARRTERALLLPFDRPVPALRSGRPRHTSRRGSIEALRSLLARTAPGGGLRAAGAADFRLIPYQLEPALACLDGETRLLIADEVGLGKTVEAGLILAELFARDSSARGLVLAPASLCTQWVAELRGRFALPAFLAEATSIQRLACLGPPEVSPWSQVALAVASFDYVKQPEVLAGMTGAPWDVVVVDEAHLVALARERSRAVGALARRSRRVVLLTATPSAGDVGGFRALCETGRLAGEPPIVVFRRTRSSLGLPVSRRTVVLRVRPTAAERRAHAALERYTAEVWHQAGAREGGRGARLAMVVLRKRAASGASALAASLARRLAWLSVDPTEASQLLLPLLDAETDLGGADEAPDAVLAAPGLADAGAERGKLETVLALAEAARADESKPRAIDRLLARVSEPVILFTEYRDTLARMAERLAAAREVAVLHGGLDLAARDASVRTFTAGAAGVLLATDAAAHGLNLQARCRFVVNIELPWVPARLEQRIGRVDRIGQSKPVHAVHLVARATCEEQVLARLAARAERERGILGEADPLCRPTSELDTAHAVFAPPGRLRRTGPPAGAGRARASRTSGRDAAPVLPVDVAVNRSLLLAARADDEAARLRAARRLQARRPSARAAERLAAGAARCARRARRADDCDRSALGVPCWTVLRRTGSLAALPLGAWCLFEARLVDRRGSLVELLPLAVHVGVTGPLAHRRALEEALPAIIGALADRLRTEARGAALARADELSPPSRARSHPLVLRETRLAGELDPPRPTGLQPGLFDRRALKQAQLERDARDRLAAASNARLAALAASTTVEIAGDPELVLVLGLAV